MDSPATFSDEVIKVNRRKATTARLCFCFVVLTLLSAAVLAAAAGLASGQDTALDRYIAKPDPSYSWKLVSTIVGEGYHGYVIDLSSQTWRTAADVDRPVWKHWLTIVKPALPPRALSHRRRAPGASGADHAGAGSPPTW